MRNIYEIISEQKALTDVNISSYDLQYTIEYMDIEYVQEGLSEGLKNAGKKVIEFIKKMIQKIKELVGRVVDFFRKSNTTVERIEQEIVEANKKAEEAPKEEPKKEEPKKEEAPKEEPKKEEPPKEEPKKEEPKKEEPKKEPKKPKADDLRAVLMISSLQVKTQLFGHIDKRRVLLTNSVNLHDATYKSIAASIKNNDGKKKPTDYQKMLCSRLFGEDYSSVIEGLREVCGDSDPEQEITIKVSDYADIIMSYIKGADDFVQRTKKAEKEIIGKFNELITRIGRGDFNNSDDVTESQLRDMELLAHSITLTLGNIFNFIMTTTTKAFSTYLKIANQAKEDYVKKIFK